jgi:hypothetical protein
VVGQPRRPCRRRSCGSGSGLEDASQRGVQADPLPGEHLAVDRLGDQHMPEGVTVTGWLGEQHLVIDRLAQAVK